MHQSDVLDRLELGHLAPAGGRRHDGQTARALNQGVDQLAAAFDHVGQRESGRQPQQHVDIGHAQIGIEQQGLASGLGHGQGQIDRDRGLADAALAAGDGNHPDRILRAGHQAQGGRQGGKLGIKRLHAGSPRGRCPARSGLFGPVAVRVGAIARAGGPPAHVVRRWCRPAADVP